jgi:hypothetical protein
MFVAGAIKLSAATAYQPKDKANHNYDNNYSGPKTSFKNPAYNFARG